MAICANCAWLRGRRFRGGADRDGAGRLARRALQPEHRADDHQQKDAGDDQLRVDRADHRDQRHDRGAGRQDQHRQAAHARRSNRRWRCAAAFCTKPRTACVTVSCKLMDAPCWRPFSGGVRPFPRENRCRRRWPASAKGAGRPRPRSGGSRRRSAATASSDTAWAPLRTRSAASDTVSETNSVAPSGGVLGAAAWPALEPADAGLDVVHQLTDFVLDVGDVLGHGVTVAIGVTGTVLASHDVPLLPAALRFREFSGPTRERWNRFPRRGVARLAMLKTIRAQPTEDGCAHSSGRARGEGESRPVGTSSPMSRFGSGRSTTQDA